MLRPLLTVKTESDRRENEGVEPRDERDGIVLLPLSLRE